MGRQAPSASIHAPICQNHSFLPARLDGVFVVWREKGIRTFSDLYINGQLSSFAQLSNKFSLPNSHFFHYLQIRHYIKENWPHLESTSTTHPFFETLLLPPDSKQLISKFVGSFTIPVSSESIREAWAKGWTLKYL